MAIVKGINDVITVMNGDNVALALEDLDGVGSDAGFGNEEAVCGESSG